MSQYAVALGSNLGDRLVFLQRAVSSIAQLGDRLVVSGLYETAPVGGPEQDPYLNAVAVFDTSLEPQALLDRLHDIENEEGRERAVRWGARTLDLDIVAWDGADVRTADLQIPHPRAAERRFVLEPLIEVWPEAPVGDGRSAQKALARVSDQDVELLAASWSDPGARRPGRIWVGIQFVWFLTTAVAMATDGSLPGESPEATRVIGGILVFGGLVLAFLSVRKLGNSLTAVPEPAQEGEFRDTGPYALARHPIYGGVVLLFLGTSLVVDSIWGAVLSLGMLGFFWMKSSYEERMLRIAYPEYSAYRSRVTRRMIPFLI